MWKFLKGYVKEVDAQVREEDRRGRPLDPMEGDVEYLGHLVVGAIIFIVTLGCWAIWKVALGGRSHARAALAEGPQERGGSGPSGRSRESRS